MNSLPPGGRLLLRGVAGCWSESSSVRVRPRRGKNPQDTFSSSCFQRGPCRAPQTRRQWSPVCQPVPSVRGQFRHRQWRGEHLGRPAGPAVHRHLALRGPQRQPGDHQRYWPGAGLVFKPRAPSCGSWSERPEAWASVRSSLPSEVTFTVWLMTARKTALVAHEPHVAGLHLADLCVLLFTHGFRQNKALGVTCCQAPLLSMVCVFWPRPCQPCGAVGACSPEGPAV